MRAALVLVAVAACGRISFTSESGASGDDTAIIDGSPDTPQATCTGAGHDEDHDGYRDSCDPCPHIAGNLDDSDGDGVGNACDPHPATTGDRIAFFESFAGTGDPNWINSDTNLGSFTGESLMYSRNSNALFWARDVTGNPRGVLAMGLGLGTPKDQSSQRQFVLASGDVTGVDYQYCELNEYGTAQATTGMVYRVDDVYMPGASGDHDLTGRLENKDFVLTYAFGSTMSCESTWPPMPSFTEPAGSNMPVTQIGFYAFAVDTEFRWFIFIETP